MSELSFIPTIGLEVHLQLKTRTKIFCSCALTFGEEPNTSVCPVCLGLPGVLPVLNRQVFRLALRAVLALGGKPSPRIQFDRKNYFYPDLPKGYQISQFEAPLGQGGFLELQTPGGVKTVRLNRIHMEEDAGKLVHDASGGRSFVDLNRAGTPLIEIVSEPDLETPEEAHQYLNTLKAILKSIGVSDCDMEKGHLRCDANVSVRPAEVKTLGKKVEIKNLNSFKAVRASLAYEIRRQTEALRAGQPLFQETRLWDDQKQKTFPMRSKEEAHDYRYFPEPDLMPFSASAREIEEARASIPELPKEKIGRFERAYGLSRYDAALLAEDFDVAVFFEKASALSKNPKATANWITGPLFAVLSQSALSLNQTKLTAEALVVLQGMVEKGQVSLQAAREKIFPDMVLRGADPKRLLEEKGLLQVSDEAALSRWVDWAIENNPKVVADFRSGKETAAMFLVGQAMKKSAGKANPGRIRELLIKRLSEGS